MTQGPISRRGFMGGVAGFAAISSSIEIVHAQGKRILKARAWRDIGTLDPGFMTGGVEIEVQFATMPRLAHIDKEGDIFVWRPTEYVESVTETDPTHIAFTLKPGFKWTDGFGELTAEDVKYSFERMLESDWKDKWVALDHVEVTGKYSGQIVLKEPFPALGVGNLVAGQGCLVCKKATEAAGGRYTTEIPATCGPYVLSEWRPKQRLVLLRNPEWMGSEPEFDEIQIHVVTETVAAELAFEGGELDITAISPNALVRYNEKPLPNSKITIAGYLTYGWLGMNTWHPKLSDIRVRKAIQRAIDVDSVLAAAFSGSVQRAHGIVPPGIVGKRNETGYSYDPHQARELLKEAGVSNLSLELKTQNRQERVVMAQVIQANLQDVGIQVDVLPIDPGTFYNHGREKKGDEWKNLQLYIMRFGTGLDPIFAFNWFVKDQIGNWNWERWSDPEFEELYQKVAATTDAKERAKMCVRMQEIMENTGAYVWLQHEPQPFVHRADISPVIVPSGEQDFRRFELV